ncbi:MAG TPA: D-alanyl-D-alanine carboxypeptidase/D-alanyl-D-alanine-endopeptidase [Gammaproteobacteria bacterium]|nr:D-alanyl-D-alanine carboxypeptidase/D-alanyl-D-alanine-endopeptidase [Gammaproteobacteria bacterium]
MSRPTYRKPARWRVAFAIFLLAASGTAFADGSLAPLVELVNDGARVSALVVRLDDGSELAAIAPDTPLAPASVSKLYVAAAALDRWGPDYQFPTRLLAAGKIHDGTLEGDLIFAGLGDPGVTNLQLWQLAHNLVERGITHVTGNLVVSAGYFGPLDQCVTKDRCEAAGESDHAYDALLSSAAVNYSTVGITVIPGAWPGAAARVALEPFSLPMFDLRNRLKTSKSKDDWKLSVHRETSGGRDILTVSGSVPAGAKPVTFSRSVSDPNLYAGETLAAFLAQAGVQVDGQVRVAPTGMPAGVVVAEVDGERMWTLLRNMLLWSNNFMADTFALDILRAQQAPPLSLTAAGAAVSSIGRALERASPLMRSHEPKVELLSGSGLTPTSRASARDIVALLDTLYHRGGLLPSFLGALSVPAYAPSRMLKAPGDPLWMERVAAKTGSLSEPHSVFALAGYLRLDDGSWGAFAVLVNGTVRHDVPLWIAIQATREALIPYLRAPRSARHR